MYMLKWAKKKNLGGTAQIKSMGGETRGVYFKCWIQVRKYLSNITQDLKKSMPLYKLKNSKWIYLE